MNDHTDPQFTLNRNQGVGTLHVEHPWEQCNTDQAEDLRKVDALEAQLALSSGDALACLVCTPDPYV